MAANIANIAEEVGISKAAVSFFLKDPQTPKVGAETKVRIQRVIEKLNYRPNALARALSSSKSKIVGILIPYDGPVFRSSFASELLSGLQTTLYKNGYSLIFLPTRGSGSRDMVKNQLANGLGFDGYVLFGTRYCSLSDMVHNADMLRKTGVPFVVVNMPAMDMPISQVIMKNELESDATEYLIGKGHEQIVLMTGRRGVPETDLAIQYYQQAHIRHGLACHPERILFGDYEREEACRVMQKFIDRGKPFTAVNCLSDTMASGVYQALSEHNRKIPDDVSVIGRNDVFFATFMNPPLSSISRPVYEAGTKAAECLLGILAGTAREEKIFLRCKLVERQSVSFNVRE